MKRADPSGEIGDLLVERRPPVLLLQTRNELLPTLEVQFAHLLFPRGIDLLSESIGAVVEVEEGGNDVSAHAT